VEVSIVRDHHSARPKMQNNERISGRKKEATSLTRFFSLISNFAVSSDNMVPFCHGSSRGFQSVSTGFFSNLVGNQPTFVSNTDRVAFVLPVIYSMTKIKEKTKQTKQFKSEYLRL
jgi:hypothetical protein